MPTLHDYYNQIYDIQPEDVEEKWLESDVFYPEKRPKPGEVKDGNLIAPGKEDKPPASSDISSLDKIDKSDDKVVKAISKQKKQYNEALRTIKSKSKQAQSLSIAPDKFSKRNNEI